VVESAGGREVVPIGTSTEASAAREADVVLVCVKSSDTDAAGRELATILAPDTAIVSLQNGVDNADRLSRALKNPVFAAVVYVGTSMEGDGVVRHAGRGDLVLGAHAATAARPEAQSRLGAIAGAFERAGVPCPVSEDIVAALWTKLTINCAFNAVSALGQSRYGRMAREAAVRDLMEAVVRETVSVARADGVALSEVALLDATWKVADAMAGQFSSTAQDIARGTRTEIDALNGFVARRGVELGVATPINAALHTLVKLREGGEELAG
jgi:2-dehydropantoate 2-reductase